MINYTDGYLVIDRGVRIDGSVNQETLLVNLERQNQQYYILNESVIIPNLNIQYESYKVHISFSKHSVSEVRIFLQSSSDNFLSAKECKQHEEFFIRLLSKELGKRHLLEVGKPYKYDWGDVKIVSDHKGGFTCILMSYL